MAGVALHVVITVCEILGGNIGPPILLCHILAHELGACGGFVVVGVTRCDRILDETHLPLEIGIHDGALIEFVTEPFEAAPAIGRAHESHVGAALECCGAGGEEVRIGLGGAVAILAIDLDGERDLAMDVATAMVVLREMAVDAVHADVHMNGRHMHCFVEFLRVVIGDFTTFGVEQVALSVALEDRPEVPAVAVVVGKLSVLHLVISVPDGLQEIHVGPLPAGRCPFGIAIENFACGVLVGILLLFRPHSRRIRLIVPHRVAHVGIHEHVGLVHVADHALTGRDRTAEGVLQRVTGFVPRNRFIPRDCGAVVAILGVLT